jgi:CotH kinase protein/Bacterial Ig-like domain (group 3)
MAMRSMLEKSEARACWLAAAGLGLSLGSCGDGNSISVTTGTQAITIHPGDQGVPLSVSVSAAGMHGPVTLAVIGLPSGISVSAPTLNPGGSGVLTFNATASADQEAFPASEIILNPQVDRYITITAAGDGYYGSVSLKLTVSLMNPAFAPVAENINLPIVSINTNGTAIADTTTEVPGSITITSADGQTSYLPNASDSDNTATFHVRGNTTAVMPKKPYHVKLNTSLDLLQTMGLSCGYVSGKSAKPTCDKSKTYNLLANYDDKTLLRDWAASALANAIPIGQGYLDSPADSPTPSGTAVLMPWAPHSLFVELYLNGVYEGNYQLIEEVKVDSNRVNITELAETDITDNITGGYLLEIDETKGEAYNFTTPLGVAIGLVDPDFSPDPKVSAQTSYITSYVDSAEAALYAGNFEDPTSGWRAYFDEASVVNFYLVNEVMGNVDGGEFYSSDYLYKAKNNPLLYMGPVWDFDISSGNVNYEAITNPTVPWMRTEGGWYPRWFVDPTFNANVIKQWNALKNNGVLNAWLARISQQGAALQQSQANNVGRWPMQGIAVWPNAEAAGSYDLELAYLLNWLGLRIAYLDGQFNVKAATATTVSVPAEVSRSQAGSSVTLSAQVSGSGTLTGTVYFLAGGVVVGASPIQGGSASIAATLLPVGFDSVQAVYGGDNANALSTSAAASVAVSQ